MQNKEEYYKSAITYQLLADYYKYNNPEKHIFYYQKHYQYMRRWVASLPFTRLASGHARIRFFHSSPVAETIHVHVNKQLLLKDLHDKNTSEYLELPEGSYQIDFTRGDSSHSILTETINIETNQSYTIATIGLEDALQLLLVTDDDYIPMNETKIRFLHLATNNPIVDIAVHKGDIVFPKVAFGTVTDYLPLTPMTVDLEVRKHGTKEVILPLNRVRAKPNLAYSIALVTHSKENTTLQALLLSP